MVDKQIGGGETSFQHNIIYILGAFIGIGIRIVGKVVPKSFKHRLVN